MSLLKTIKQQLGLSVTPANNFTLDASADNGTMKLARGNAGATTQDILTVDAAGKVAFPQNIVPVFRGYATAAVIPTGTLITPSITENFDLGGFFTNAPNKFQPTIAGYYQFNASVYFNALPSNGYVKLRKNGGTFVGGTQGNNYMSQASALVHLNGTTDYVDIILYQSSGGDLSTDIEFTGFLARAA